MDSVLAMAARIETSANEVAEMAPNSALLSRGDFAVLDAALKVLQRLASQYSDGQ